MSIVSDNIKYLRRRSGLTQEQMAEKIGIKRSLLGAYEEGRADPRLNNLLKISEIFDISVDTLISIDLTKNDPTAALPTGKNTNGGMKVLAITVDSEDRENIEIVPQKAAAGYLNGYSDPEYIEELPKFQLPILPKNASYRAFEISGDSMLPLQPGTIIIGKYLESTSDIKNGKTYVLVTKKEGVVYKRVFNYLNENGKLFLVSDNEQYSSYEVPGDEVLEIWEAKAYISLSFPEPSNAEGMTLKKLAGIVMDLQQEVIRLKNG